MITRLITVLYFPHHSPNSEAAQVSIDSGRENGWMNSDAFVQRVSSLGKRKRRYKQPYG